MFMCTDQTSRFGISQDPAFQCGVVVSVAEVSAARDVGCRRV